MSFPSQGYTPTTIPLARVRATVGSTVLTSNQEWFPSDIVPLVDDNLQSEIVIVFVFEKRAIIQVTYDSGVTWYNLNNNLKMEAETLNSISVPVINTDQVNFRTSTAGTLRFARASELR